MNNNNNISSSNGVVGGHTSMMPASTTSSSSYPFYGSFVVSQQQQHQDENRIYYMQQQYPSKLLMPQQQQTMQHVQQQQQGNMKTFHQFQNCGSFGHAGVNNAQSLGCQSTSRPQQQQQYPFFDHSRGVPLSDLTNTIQNNNHLHASMHDVNQQKTTARGYPPQQQKQEFSFFSQKFDNNSFAQLTQPQTVSQRVVAQANNNHHTARRSKSKPKPAPAFTQKALFMGMLSDDEAEEQVPETPSDSQLDEYFGNDHAMEIFQHMRNTEVNHRANARYMEDVQKDLNQVMRAILVDWLIEVCNEFGLLPETLYLAVNITDRTLAKMVIPRNKLQMIGITSLFLAAKYFEMEPPLVDEFVFITDNTYKKDEILQTESVILTTLSFDLTVVTSYDFLDRYLKVAGANDLVSDLAHFLSELTLQEYSMISYLPSAIAASCVILALFSLNAPHWTTTLQKYTGYAGPELRNCVATILRLYQDLDNSNLTAVKEKYSHESKNRVALYTCFRSFDYRTLSI